MAAMRIMGQQRPPPPTTRDVWLRISGGLHHRKLNRPLSGRDAADHANGHSGQPPEQSRRAELVALRRLGTVEDCAKVVEVLAADLSDYVTGAVIPIDGGLVRG
jgi:NAD(P)-dependent dehydrogenase (short-subunit alcohol dehydrogenase family)